MVRTLNDNLLKEIMVNEELISQLRQDNPDAEKQEFNPVNFQMSKHTKTACVDFLKENDVELETWISDLDDCDKLKKVLKIFFTLNSNYNREEWCLFPTILDDEAFYAGAKQVLLRDAELLSKYHLLIDSV